MMTSALLVNDLLITPLFDDSYASRMVVSQMLILEGSLNSTFTIGIDSSLNIPSLVLQFKHAAAGFIPIRPLFIYITQNRDIAVTLPAIITVAAGGRSTPLAITLQNAPFIPLVFQFYVVNNHPSYSDVYPRQLNITSNSGVFWISVGGGTSGSTGQILVLKQGADSAIFQLQ
jgi:hypothetical protein